MVATGKKKKIFDGRFEIIGIVGRGSQSVVYHAQNATNPNNQVAIKVLVNHGKTKSNQELNDRLRKEALAMVAARHRYVIRIEDFHSLDALCYLSMEYAAEGDLRKYVTSRNGKLQPLQAERLFMQMVEALCAVHKSGIVHRDIKPDNILVLNDQEVRLGDFGTAVLPGDPDSIEELKRGVGTFSYMAPEVLEGIEYSESADLYALAVTFYELLAGKHPFEGVPLMKQLTVRQNQNIIPITKLAPNISANFGTVLMKCMSYNKSERPKSADDLLEAMISGKGDLLKKSPVKAPAVAPVRTAPLVEKVETIKEPTLKEPLAVIAPNPLVGTDSRPTIGALGVSSRTASTSSLVKTAPIVKANPESVRSSTSELLIDRTQNTPQNTNSPLARMMTEHQSATELLSDSDSHHLNDQGSEFPKTSEEESMNEVPKGPTKSLARELIAKGADKNGSKSKPKITADTTKKKGSPAVFIIGFLLLAALAWQFVPNKNRSKPTLRLTDADTTTEEVIEFEAPSSEEPLIPEAATQMSQFPLLAAGMYHGEISGLYRDSNHSLTIISFPEAQKIAFIVGIEGWIPTVISTEELNIGDSITVPSNGLVLKFTGQSVDDSEVVGFFKNSIANRQGQWRVKHLTKSEEDN